MAFIGTILQKVVQTQKSFKQIKDGDKQQEKALRKLLVKAQYTSFGAKYNFQKILKSKNIFQSFQQNVPLFDYNKMLDEWWYRTRKDEENVSWPGKIKYYALTSGTSDAASKTVPVSSDMIRAMKRASLKQTQTLSLFKLPGSFYEKCILGLGGTTSLAKIGDHYEGDLSGILAKNQPYWFSRFYKPGKKIAQIKDWQTKLDEITLHAKKWDVSAIAGVPAWVQIIIEKIIKHYGVNNIHEIWPNFSLFIHGGVSFLPYKNSFAKLLGREIYYLETYLASEGFIAFRSADENAMQLVLNNGIYYEFIPYNDSNFNSDGQMNPNAEVLTLKEVKEGVDYALLVSTCAGAWRYLIGDTIKFTSVKNYEIIITGRTKHFLSMCGEHMSVDNMNRAIEMASEELNITINEYTVAGIPYEGLFAHEWYIGTDAKVDEKMLAKRIDENLHILNDDYIVERRAALKEVFVKVVPTQLFYDFLKSIGREGGQNKFPRVLRSNQYNEWKSFLNK